MEELEPCIINNARGQTAATQGKWVSMGNTWVLDNLLTTYNGLVGDYAEINHGPLCHWLDLPAPALVMKMPIMKPRNVQ